MVKRTNRRNRRRAGRGTIVSRLPAKFASVGGDSMTMHLRGMYPIKYASALNAFSNGYLIMRPATGFGDSLGTLNSNLNSIRNMYDLFTVTSLDLEVIPVTGFGAPEGYVYAVGFEPDDTSESKLPTNVNDVMVARHSVMVRGHETGRLQLNPSLYHNDWCSTDIAAVSTGASYRQLSCGYVNVWSNNTAGAVVDSLVAYLKVSYTITFAGLKYS